MFNHIWTPEEDENLQALFVQGLTDRQIGEAMQRTAHAIEKQRKKLGLRRWKTWELQRKHATNCSSLD